MEGRVLAIIFLFMIILIYSPLPSSCARLTGFPTSTLRDDDFICYYGDQVAAETSNPFEKDYGDDVAIKFDKYYHSHLNRLPDDNLQVQTLQNQFTSTPRSMGITTTSTFNVMNYVTVGNGQVDDTHAFLKAWGDVCGSTQTCSC